ncbi:tetrapyrrole biosynthesis, uroporphyrinogen III synthase [Xylariales sp. PMI_506]|nr:tetrapyrrole biosynthesis, uroporphyrinogen III synthase [Xylariales sp. PMI_506]
MSSSSPEKQPILLLKTKSTPADAYEDLFSTPREGLAFEPTFVPVLQHQFEDDGMKTVRALLEGRKIARGLDAAYGGLIFTSQRAVEAFAKLVEEHTGPPLSSTLGDVPVYSVGPATTRALRAVPLEPPLQIFGEHTGNGEALAHFILEHYEQWYADRQPAGSEKPPLLFLVGEQRRDIIPKTLMDPALGPERRIGVTEVVVYGTGVMESFPEDFAQVLRETAARPRRWVVVFSPTGCESLLSGLGMLDPDTGKVGEVSGDRTTYIATIGPTTRSYLKKTFAYEPDVCSEKPSPEGVWEGIAKFTDGLK